MPAIAAPLLWPAAVEAGKAVAFLTAIVVSAFAAKEIAEEIDEALDEREREASSSTADTAKDKVCVNNCSEEECPPCVPPAGTIRVERVDRVPPSRRHAPCPGDHAHLVQRNQAPYPNCRCFWNKARPDVVCLEPGDSLPYPMK